MQNSPRAGLGSTPARRHSLNLQAEYVLPIRPARTVSNRAGRAPVAKRREGEGVTVSRSRAEGANAMKAWVLDGAGGIDNLQLAERPRPEPRRQEVVLR